MHRKKKSNKKGKGVISDAFDGLKKGISYVGDKIVDTGFYVGNKILDPGSNLEFGERHVA